MRSTAHGVVAFGGDEDARADRGPEGHALRVEVARAIEIVERLARGPVARRVGCPDLAGAVPHQSEERPDVIADGPEYARSGGARALVGQPTQVLAEDVLVVRDRDVRAARPGCGVAGAAVLGGLGRCSGVAEAAGLVRAAAPRRVAVRRPRRRSRPAMHPAGTAAPDPLTPDRSPTRRRRCTRRRPGSWFLGIVKMWLSVSSFRTQPPMLTEAVPTLVSSIQSGLAPSSDSTSLTLMLVSRVGPQLFGRPFVDVVLPKAPVPSGQRP